jgi:type I restriction enzyme S subunit
MTDSNSNYSDLPQGWKWVTLNDIANIKYGKNLAIKSLLENGKHPVFGANGIIGYYNVYHYETEQVLISCRGAYSGTINYSPPKCFITNNSLVLDIINKDITYKKYLYYSLQSIDKTKLVTGTAQPQVTVQNASHLLVPLPPLPEQHRIVEKIEELFSELDNGVASLKKALEQLKTYRQAVLKWAFEGKLTEKWRNTHQDSLEDADTLLEQIKAERKRHYQQQLEDWKQALKEWENNGKETKKPTAPRKQEYYSPLKQEETNKLWKIPDKWTWEKVGNICQSIVPNRDKPKSFSGNIPWITTPDIDSDLITLKLLPNHLGLNINEVELYNARVIPKNSVIMTCVGSFGIVCINTISCVINQQLHAFMTHSYINNKYLAYALKIQQSWMEKKSTSTTVVYLNKTNSNSVPIPLCSLQEQTKIVQEIESRLSICDQLEATLTENLDKAEALRQSILKRAFEGKLVL